MGDVRIHILITDTGDMRTYTDTSKKIRRKYPHFEDMCNTNWACIGGVVWGTVNSQYTVLMVPHTLAYVITKSMQAKTLQAPVSMRGRPSGTLPRWPYRNHYPAHAGHGGSRMAAYNACNGSDKRCLDAHDRPIKMAHDVWSLSCFPAKMDQKGEYLLYCQKYKWQAIKGSGR